MMLNLFIASVLFAVVLAQQEQQQQNETVAKRVLISVYYESLCPDSKKFIVNQLYPTLTGNLGKYVDLKLIPYGKSNYVYNKTSTMYQFKCHHGSQECEGNKIHACAIQKIEGGGNSKGLGFNQQTLAFVKCLMDRAVDKGPKDTEFPISDCVVESNVTNMASISGCTHHTEGERYLVNYATETDSLRPGLKSVPTILFNQTYSDEDNKQAQENLEALVCKYVGLPDCPELSSSAAVYVGAFALLLLSQSLVRLF